jgi:hypothetical protein
MGSIESAGRVKSTGSRDTYLAAKYRRIAQSTATSRELNDYPGADYYARHPRTRPPQRR